jgi:hypothetical protein
MLVSTYAWLFWPMVACVSYFTLWGMVRFSARDTREDPVLESLEAWSTALGVHVLMPAILIAAWVATWLGVPVTWEWNSPRPAFVTVLIVCLGIDLIAIALVNRDRRHVELLIRR